MKSFFSLAAVSAALLSLCACTQFETVKGDPMNTKIYTLDNGLQVYMTVNRETPRIQTYIAVRAGGKNGPDNSTGLAHYFEHLMFKGTEQFGTIDYAAEEPMLDSIESLFNLYRETEGEEERARVYHQIDSISYEASKLSIPNEYDKLMAVIGAEGTNAMTSMDGTVYTEDIPSNQVENWARIQADRFRNVVLRGFHTELETIYEEKNMSLTDDQDKLWEGLDAALFPSHPYGQRTVLGTQEHLKNPSVTDVKKFHDDYYVPNNIRICLSGDFDPKEMVKTIEKYFGDWEPNPSIPVLEYPEEQPVTEPVVKEVYGLEAESIAMGWRLPAPSDLKTFAVGDIAGSILCNGHCGLVDLDVIQQQKVLDLYAGVQSMADYSEFIVIGAPKEGQTLEEVRDIALAEMARLRAGDFDPSLISATVNNIKLSQMHLLESNRSRVNRLMESFINGIDWKDYAHMTDFYSSVTKEDVVEFANRYLSDNSCAVIYKRQGPAEDVLKVSAPEITPIVTNRDLQSAFLREIQNAEVRPVEPVYVDFSKDMSQFSLADGVDVLYKKNEVNDIFQLELQFNRGVADNPALALVPDYLSYLGTADMTAEEIASRMYALACNYSIRSDAFSSTVSISGLSENMTEALAVFEGLALGAVGDEDILSGVKEDIFKSRDNSLKNQSSCFRALRTYCTSGEDYIKSSVVPNAGIAAMTSEDILEAVKDLLSLGHEVRYYGPMSESGFRKAMADHYVADGAAALPERFSPRLQTPSSKVVLAQYDANQIYYYQYSNRGETFDPSVSPSLAMYNGYFGEGMNGIVLQEMREARGLAYSASASITEPSNQAGSYEFGAFIATQNDKMRTAIEAFDDIINNMPESEAAFSVARDAISGQLRTQRCTGASVLSEFKRCRRLGLAGMQTRQIFEGIQSMTMEDVRAFQQKWIKDRNYTYAILGDVKDLDTDYLKTLGLVEVIPIEKAFGY